MKEHYPDNNQVSQFHTDQVIQEIGSLNDLYNSPSYGDSASEQQSIITVSSSYDHDPTVAPGLISPENIPFIGLARAIKRWL